MTLPAPLTEFSLSALSRPVETYTLHLTTPEIGGRPVEDNYDLGAPYQRGSVWTTDQRRALVKSFLMGLPVGTVIVARLPYSIEKFYRVVDGKQRIETMRLFVTNEFTVPGWWFSADQLTEGETARPRDVTFSDLNGRGHRSTIGAILPSLEFDVTRKWIPEAREWETVPKDQWVTREAELYLLVNGGGTAQTDDDMARAAALAAGARVVNAREMYDAGLIDARQIIEGADR